MALIDRQYLKTRAFNKYGDTAKLRSVKALLEAKKTFSYSLSYDIFLSHAYLDADEIEVIKQEFEEVGLSVYIDWIEDEQLEREHVSSFTAEIIRMRMKNCKSLIYAFSDNSKLSKWMPWELGYFDGFNGHVCVMPVVDTPNNSDDYKGVEFVGIYPYITKATTTYFVQENENTYVSLPRWVQGVKPTKH